MKLGICCSPDRLPLAKEAGLDYFEANLSRMAALDDHAFRAQTRTVERYGLPAEAAIGFFPLDMKLHPLTQDPAETDDILRRVEAHCERAFTRFTVWGGQIAVLGAGRARSVPEGDVPYETRRQKAEAHLARVLAVCGEAAVRYGITVAIEPLSHEKTDLVNTIREGARMARLSSPATDPITAPPSVATMVDFYHLWIEGDAADTLPAYADLLCHAHIARPHTDRGLPREEDRSTLAHWASLLSRCPRISRVSLECADSPTYPSDLMHAMPLLTLFRDLSFH